MLYAVLCKDKPDHIHVRMENRPRHLEWLDGLNDKGTLKIAGPFLDGDDKPCGSMLIIEADSQADAEAIAAETVQSVERPAVRSAPTGPRRAPRPNWRPRSRTCAD